MPHDDILVCDVCNGEFRVANVPDSTRASALLHVVHVVDGGHLLVGNKGDIRHVFKAVN